MGEPSRLIQGRVAQIWKDRVEFCERNLPTFREERADSDNYGEFRYSMFTIVTQHIWGHSVTELIDRGLEIEKKRKSL